MSTWSTSPFLTRGPDEPVSQDKDYAASIPSDKLEEEARTNYRRYLACRDRQTELKKQEQLRQVAHIDKAQILKHFVLEARGHFEGFYNGKARFDCGHGIHVPIGKDRFAIYSATCDLPFDHPVLLQAQGTREIKNLLDVAEFIEFQLVTISEPGFPQVLVGTETRDVFIDPSKGFRFAN